MNIESVPNLLEVLSDSPLSQMFRGQTRDWPLLPSIGRYPEAVKRYQDWRTFHEEIIIQFLRLGHPYLAGLNLKDTDNWVLGQHHGLPTRLLDTSTNPLKALFFAINAPADDSYDGVLWVFSYTAWREDLDKKYRPFWDAELVAYLPPQLDSRLMAQEGSFISYPLPKHTKPLLPMNQLKQDDVSFTKITIPSSAKPKLRRELDLLGIQSRLLFPDLGGVARGISLTVSQS